MSTVPFAWRDFILGLEKAELTRRQLLEALRTGPVGEKDGTAR